MLLERLCKASLLGSPIGHIPLNYPRLSQLCKTASIRYRDETIRQGEERYQYREWAVVGDAKPAVDTRGITRGMGSTKFHQFCMLLDYLESENPKWSRAHVLDETIDRRLPNTAVLMKMPWRKMNDQLAVMGLKNYEILKSKRQKSEAELPDF